MSFPLCALYIVIQTNVNLLKNLGVPELSFCIGPCIEDILYCLMFLRKQDLH